MPVRLSPFELHFEIVFLENYARLKPNERKAIDKAVRLLSANPRHPSLNVHKAKHVKGKYATYLPISLPPHLPTLIFG